MKNFLLKLTAHNINPFEVAATMTSLLGVKVSKTTLKKDIEEHPDYPSLLSISDVFNNFGINNVAVRFDPQKFTKIPVPFICQIKSPNKGPLDFTVIKSVDDKRTQCLDPKTSTWKFIDNELFLKQSSGIALLVEANENAGEEDYEKKIKEERQKRNITYATAVWFPLLMLLGVFLTVKNTTELLLTIAFFILTFIGAMIGFLLVFYELDQHNPLLQQICSAGKKTSCEAILQSKAAKIAGISWSAIGFSYFLGQLLMFLFLGVNNAPALFSMAWINVFALPYIIFSVYYQWQIAKQWCILCLSVQSILLMQFVVSFIAGWHSYIPIESISAELILKVLLIFTLPLFICVTTINALRKGKEGKIASNELQKIKHNSQIFDAILQNQRSVTQDPKGLGLILGNKNAPFKIIKVCNPFCNPCAIAHPMVDALLHNNPNIQVQILFPCFNKDDHRTPVVRHFLEIAKSNDENRLIQALDDWYLAENKDYEMLARKYPLNIKEEEHENQIDQMREWCDQMEISATPTFFVNNHKLPSTYQISDLKYFFSI